MASGSLATRKPSSVLVGLLLCGLGMYLCLTGATHLYHAYLLNGSVATTSGTVERLYSSRGRRSTYYHVTYSYVGGNKAVTTNVTTSQGIWASLRVGEKIPVRYLPDAPAISEPDVAGERVYALEHGWMDSLIPLLFIGGGYYIAFLSPKGSK